MPIYTFECKCGNKLDILCNNSDRDFRACSKCGCGMVRQFPIPGSPKFKGNGFYETDYKNKSVG